jgi:hypothetical protein
MKFPSCCLEYIESRLESSGIWAENVALSLLVADGTENQAELLRSNRGGLMFENIVVGLLVGLIILYWILRRIMFFQSCYCKFMEGYRSKDGAK